MGQRAQQAAQALRAQPAQLELQVMTEPPARVVAQQALPALRALTAPQVPAAALRGQRAQQV